MKSAIKEFASKGAVFVDYANKTTLNAGKSSKRVHRIDVVVRRNIMTSINQTACTVCSMRCEELGWDLVEVSAHGGARPSHADWQGEIYSISGKSNKYKKFSSSTGYGSGDGLGGWNCKHNFSPYKEGMARTYSKEQLDDYNDKKFSYNDKKYTEYEIEQLMRNNERNIRKWKREVTALDTANIDSSFERGKVREWQSAQRDLVNQSGIPRDYTRERAGKQLGLQEVSESVIIKKLKDSNIQYKKRISLNEIIVDVEDNIKIQGTKKHFTENLMTKDDRRNLSLEACQILVDNAKLVLYQEKNSTLKFLANNGYVILNLDKEIVTAVPQKWRKKYDKYLKGE